MSKIRSRDTKFEKEFIETLRKKTRKKFQLSLVLLRGKPDIVFLKDKMCVFLDSDFWHGWRYPRWKHLLKDDFWREKIEKNRKRDVLTTQYLKRKDWKVLRIWEHEIKKDPEKSVDKIIKFLK